LAGDLKGLLSEGLHDFVCSQSNNWCGQLKQHAIGSALVWGREMNAG